MTATAAPSGWQLETDSATAYERYLVPAFFAAWADRLVALAAVAPGERVLDVGCGTGIVARTAARAVGPEGSVTGVDLNEGMLVAARKAAKGLTTIEWRRGDAAALDLREGSFDVVLCQEALQFFPDRPAALAEMRRVLAPGGRLAFSLLRGVRHQPPYGVLADALARHVGPPAGAGMRSPFLDLSVEDVRGLVEAAGFRDARVVLDVAGGRYPSASEMLRREAASSPLAGAVAGLSVAARDALVTELTRSLRDWTDDDGVLLPFQRHLVTARA